MHILSSPIGILCKSFANPLAKSNANPSKSYKKPIQIRCNILCKSFQIVPSQILLKSYANPMRVLFKSYANPSQDIANPVQILTNSCKSSANLSKVPRKFFARSYANPMRVLFMLILTKSYANPSQILLKS